MIMFSIFAASHQNLQLMLRMLVFRGVVRVDRTSRAPAHADDARQLLVGASLLAARSPCDAYDAGPWLGEQGAS